MLLISLVSILKCFNITKTRRIFELTFGCSPVEQSVVAAVVSVVSVLSSSASSLIALQKCVGGGGVEESLLLSLSLLSLHLE